MKRSENEIIQPMGHFDYVVLILDHTVWWNSCSVEQCGHYSVDPGAVLGCCCCSGPHSVPSVPCPACIVPETLPTPPPTRCFPTTPTPHGPKLPHNILTPPQADHTTIIPTPPHPHTTVAWVAGGRSGGRGPPHLGDTVDGDPATQIQTVLKKKERK